MPSVETQIHTDMGTRPADGWSQIEEALLDTDILDSSLFCALLRIRGINHEDATALLRDPRSQDPLLKALEDQNNIRNRFIAGEILTATPIGGLPPKIAAMLPSSDISTDARVFPFHSGWTLCADAEYFMESSNDEGKSVLINGFLLVKGEGRLSAVALETVSSPIGTFYEGSWYSPVDRLTRNLVEDGIGMNRKRMNHSGGQWAYMRPTASTVYSQTPHQYLENVREYVHDMSTA